MQKLKNLCRNLIDKKWFELLIIGVIIINSALIGVETFLITPTILLVQHIILGIFTFEIAIRFVAREDAKSFFKSGWNIFDLSLVLISYIPESLFEGSSTVMVIRILRIFRVLRLLRASEEIKLIVAVLSKSFSALFYNGLFFAIFTYLFAIIGSSLFKFPDYDSMTPEMQSNYHKFVEVAPSSPSSYPDPYGSLTEASFTLFRVVTGDDWTDLRYSLVKANEFGLIHAPSFAITAFHVIWTILAAFLLLNLLLGAIVNNYQIIMEESRRKKELEKGEQT